MPDLWISNARVIDPASRRNAIGDLFVRGGRIVASLTREEATEARIAHYSIGHS